ncbi:hypothetical protein EVJ58_g5596 [Rhodofomes roseus]|uniref:Uncharacterized protein n=1 Tax=Rhodofomes roseus TaxID=34475 RepID=A0A4Y9YCW6_9APHY|nr:hypothetical protein EVJ58_g5596 [Rhodofomes roseus]
MPASLSASSDDLLFGGAPGPSASAAAVNGANLDVAGAKKEEKDGSAEPDDKDGQDGNAAAVKANKGMILKKSVEYIRIKFAHRKRAMLTAIFPRIQVPPAARLRAGLTQPRTRTATAIIPLVVCAVLGPGRRRARAARGGRRGLHALRLALARGALGPGPPAREREAEEVLARGACERGGDGHGRRADVDMQDGDGEETEKSSPSAMGEEEDEGEGGKRGGAAGEEGGGTGRRRA